MAFQNNIERAEQSTGGAGMTRRFATAELENLIQEIKSLPWSVGYDEGDETWVIHATHPTLPIPLDVGTAYTAAAARVMVAAPALVADYHRVLTELEALRDHARDVRGHDATADDITRILGDNHE